jgi:hypothetical protein
MKRKLLILDAVLVAAAIAAGVQFRKSWVAAKVQEAGLRPYHINPVALAQLPPLAVPAAVVPASYAKVAQQMLFDPSRNSEVVIEPRPPQPPPPPPPPKPPLPSFHGVLNVGAGPVVILSVGAGSQHQATRPGDGIGQFKLLSVNSDGLTFEWNGQQVVKTAEELTDREHAKAVVDEAAAGRISAQPRLPQPALDGPGEITRGGSRRCNVNDGLTEGTVREGFKKVVIATPFGQNCSWDPVK